MTSLREEVARAMHATSPKGSADTFEIPHVRDVYERAADAAIAIVTKRAAERVSELADSRERERLLLINPRGALGSEIHTRVTMLRTAADAIEALSKDTE
tara:strand:- start:244 stop:543 length:300 start_codon:yes stop_codon:yes gene_type:complete